MRETLDNIWRIIAQLGGFAVVVTGLSAWLSKIWAERILEADRQRYRTEVEEIKAKYDAVNKRVQADLDHTVYVNRVQFETEFKALSELWGRVTDVRFSMSGLRAGTDLSESRQTDEEKKVRFEERFRAYQNSVKELSRAVQSLSPFYPKEIFEQILAVLTVLTDEEIDLQIQTGYPFSAEWYKTGFEVFSKFCDSSDGLSEMIRKRISQLALYRE